MLAADLSGWCTVCILWLLLFLVAYLFLMASLSVMDYVPWKSWFRSLIGMEDPAGGGDHNNPVGRGTALHALNPADNRHTVRSPIHPSSKNDDQISNKNAENVRIFGYQQAGRVEETLIYPLSVHGEVGSSSESADSLTTAGSLTTTATDNMSNVTLPSRMSLHGDLGVDSCVKDEDDVKNDTEVEQSMVTTAKTFIKWLPFKEGIQNQQFDSLLDREDRPRGVLAWELASHEHMPRSKSSMCFTDTTEVVSPVRLTISDSALGVPFLHFGSTAPAGGGGGDKHSLRRVHCDPSRFEYHRNRRYISTLLRDGVSMKATLYLQLPSTPDSSRIRSNYKAVLLLSKEAARQVRHQDLVFLFNLAMLLQTSPDKVLLLQQVN